MISSESPIEKVLSALASAGISFKKQGNGYSARCPSHDDHSPSLSIGEGSDGRVLLNCFAHCSTEEICSALGLTLADLFEPSEPSPRYHQPTTRHDTKGGKRFPTLKEAIDSYSRRMGTPAGVWHYCDATGEKVAAAIRFNKSDGGKEFRLASRDGGDWFLKAPASPRPLYRLHELVSLPPEARVYVCEGEKAADAACELELPATTSFGGSQAANKTDWTPLAGRDVVLLPDHDAAGGKYADAVKRILAELNPRPTLRIVTLPDLPDGGDIVEFIAARTAAGDSLTIIRDTVDELAESVPVVCLNDVSQEPASLADETTSRLISRRVCDVALEPLEWLWPNRVPLGKVTLLAGDPGLGKSFLTCDMAARVSKGAAWPDNELPQPVGSVILFNCEDGLADTIRPRLENADADLTKIVAIEGVHFFDPKTENVRQRGFSLAVDLPRLADELAKLADSRLVVIDPVSAYLGDADSHKNADVRGLLAPLAELAERHRVAVVLVNHLSKSAGAKAIYRSMGSIGFAGAARAVWHVAKDPEHELRRLILPVKMNLAADPTGLAYSIEDGVVRWEADPVHMTADELLAKETKAAAGFRESRKSEAAEWLGERLSDGPVPSKDVFRDGKDAGFNDKTLREAFKNIGGHSSKTGMDGPWCWSLRSNPTAADQQSSRASDKSQPLEDATNLPKMPDSQNEGSSPSSGKFGDEPTSK